MAGTTQKIAVQFLEQLHKPVAVPPRPSQFDDEILTITTNCQLSSLSSTVEGCSTPLFENFASDRL